MDGGETVLLLANKSSRSMRLKLELVSESPGELEHTVSDSEAFG